MVKSKVITPEYLAEVRARRSAQLYAMRLHAFASASWPQKFDFSLVQEELREALILLAINVRRLVEILGLRKKLPDLVPVTSAAMDDAKIETDLWNILGVAAHLQRLKCCVDFNTDEHQIVFLTVASDKKTINIEPKSLAAVVGQKLETPQSEFFIETPKLDTLMYNHSIATKCPSLSFPSGRLGISSQRPISRTVRINRPNSASEVDIVPTLRRHIVDVRAGQRLDGSQRLFKLGVGVKAVEFVFALPAHPVSFGHFEILGQAHSRVSRKRGLFAGQALNARPRHANIAGNFSSGQAKRDHEFLPQHFAGMYRSCKANIHHVTSVIIHKFNVVSAIFFPSKADAPLVIYTDRMLARAVAFQQFKSISRRDSQIIKLSGHGQRPEAAFNRLNQIRRKSFRHMPSGNFQKPFVTHRGNHRMTVSPHDTSRQQIPYHAMIHSTRF